MAKYRQVHTHIWDDDKFEEYSPEAKLLFIYGFSNTHRNEAGIYPISIKKMAFETGLSIEATEAALKEIIDSGSWKYDYEAKVLWVVNALKYQSVNDKCLIAISRDIESLSTPLADEYIQHCSDIGYPLNTHSIPMPNPQETQAGKGKGKGKGKDKKPPISPFENYTENSELIQRLYEFVEMRKAIKKTMTDRAKKELLSKLDALASTDEAKIAILEQSIFNSWQGVFPLKQEGRASPKDMPRSGTNAGSPVDSMGRPI
jgi:hypothetical protein